MTGKPLLAYFGSLYSLGAQTQTLPLKPDFLPSSVVTATCVPSDRVDAFLNSAAGPVGMDIFEFGGGFAAEPPVSPEPPGAFPKETVSPLSVNGGIS
ncbi:hypothetical protein ACFXDJ_05715 [Streptomyces sp. NPDC059443]|uniref:hypothetical protein n=1 Tax=Streptomyces sp. NPDC059443 TaxID=3346831 RepID=UPI0036CF47F0